LHLASLDSLENARAHLDSFIEDEKMLLAGVAEIQSELNEEEKLLLDAEYEYMLLVFHSGLDRSVPRLESTDFIQQRVKYLAGLVVKLRDKEHELREKYCMHLQSTTPYGRESLAKHERV